MKLVTASMKQREAGGNRVVFQLAHWQVGVSARVLIKFINHAPLAPIATVANDQLEGVRLQMATTGISLDESPTSLRS